MFRTLSKCWEKKSPARRARTALGFEALEDRLTPATMSLMGGVLTFNATAGEVNDVTVSQSGGVFTIHDNGANIFGPFVGNGTHTIRVNGGLFQSLTINLGDRNDSMFLATTSVSLINHPVHVDGGSGDDLVSVGGDLGRLVSNFSVSGGGGALDRLIVFDTATTLGQTFTLNSTRVQRTFAGAIDYSDMDRLTVEGGSGHDRFNVQGTAAGTPVTILGGAGNDIFDVGGNDLDGLVTNNLDRLDSALTVRGQDGSDAVNFNDQDNIFSDEFLITSTTVQRDFSALTTYELMEVVTVNAGGGDNEIIVASTASGVPVNINAGAGDDEIHVGDFAGGDLDLLPSTVTVDGQDDVDAMFVNDMGDSSNASLFIRFNAVDRTGAFFAPYAHVESLTVSAGSGNNLIRVDSVSAGTPVRANGNGGVDTLDYSAFTGAASVNLTLGTATALANGISGMENVTGSRFADWLVGDGNANILRGGIGNDILQGQSGNDVLLGESNDDQLFGEGGRDLLIGGFGVDNLRGGLEQDIVIGGTTLHDNSTAALQAIMAEWGRTTRTYSQRITALRLGGGLNGTTRLFAGTVMDDGMTDALRGEGDLDWFWGTAVEAIDLVPFLEQRN